ncbi:hypothetical protein Hamer_G021977 [Homarus americanus]|uniref:Secreted protein n=1 Tax=Homarus americanus TaxID=6706 RepID=A0A8J5JII6_HOMAM|nr:hypothetical protein Hamer_G021977 [Homarus americanus]
MEVVVILLCKMVICWYTVHGYGDDGETGSIQLSEAIVKSLTTTTAPSGTYVHSHSVLPIVPIHRSHTVCILMKTIL